MAQQNGRTETRSDGASSRPNTPAVSEMQKTYARRNTPRPENLYALLHAATADIISGQVDRRDALAVKSMIMGQVAVARHREDLGEMADIIAAQERAEIENQEAKAAQRAKLLAELAALDAAA